MKYRIEGANDALYNFRLKRYVEINKLGIEFYAAHKRKKKLTISKKKQLEEYDQAYTKTYQAYSRNLKHGYITLEDLELDSFVID